MPTNAELAKVHIAKRDLKLTDPLYRGFLNVLFGETSAKDLTHEQVEELLELTSPIGLPLREAFEPFYGVPIHHLTCYVGQHG